MARRRAKSHPGPYLIQVELLPKRLATPDQPPYCLPSIRNLGTLQFHPKVTFFVGENGSGKSTLLEAIALGNGLNPEGGSRNFNFADPGVALAVGSSPAAGANLPPPWRLLFSSSRELFQRGIGDRAAGQGP